MSGEVISRKGLLTSDEMEELMLVPSTCEAEEVGNSPGDDGVEAQSVINCVVSGQLPSR